ncbi:1-acyl-sn-glycerol-3-phosphate acyltransferase [Parabacteroides sp. OttesenSCG-928-G06]|nr:1-acyl-sn-glycerol-3-phosphate acyltransferase [Parabacteroides sp. OttesenSCG-928-G06]
MEKIDTKVRKRSKKDIPGWGYKLFKAYVRFVFQGLYNRKTYVLNRENIPEKGALMIVSNHQNSLNDALALVLAVGERGGRKVRAITRADAFKPVIGKLFRWIGLLPAFRMQYDGAETLSNNTHSFSDASEEILNDGTVIIYPEAGHQDKHWLGTFTYGYLKILFDAAEASGFEKEIYLLPSCNHYEDYLGVQTDMLIRFGEPIALSPFYALYQTKPRTAQRQVNALVREQISQMMLNITDLENYDTIDYIRNSYGVNYARREGLDPDYLPDKLEADKRLFAKLDAKKQAGVEEADRVYEKAAILDKSFRKLDLPDDCFEQKPTFGKILIKGLLLLLLSPLALLALIPNFLVFFAPEWINKKIKDLMFHGTIRVILSALVTIPLACIGLLIGVWVIWGSFPLALLSIVSLPILYIFVVYYNKVYQRTIREYYFWNLWRRKLLTDVERDRRVVHGMIDKLLYN